MQNNSNPFISVVIPVYGCSKCLYALHKRLSESLNKITSSYEIILINDSSPDNSWSVIDKLCERDQRVKGINLSRNFGQHYAITAGLDHVNGDWIVVMDCDLQDQPEEIEKLYYKILEGYDIVFGRRNKRQDNPLKKLGSSMFYKVFEYFTEQKTDNTVANFSIVKRQVINSFKLLKEKDRAYPIIIRWLGFNVGYIDIEHSKRAEGKSSYSFSKLWNLAIDNIVAQSNKPLRLSIKFGFTISSLSFIYGLYLIIRYVFFMQPISGWTSVMVSLYFIGGLLFANLGIVGIYIGKIFDEVKKRPLYVVKEKKNLG